MADMPPRTRRRKLAQQTRYIFWKASLAATKAFDLPRRRDWKNLLVATDEYTMLDRLRRLTILRLADSLNRESVEGAFVECGVARGGVAGLLGVLAKMSERSRNLWLFDSFEGLPEPTAQDGLAASRFAEGRTQGRLMSIGKCVGELKEVERLLFERLNIPRESVTLKKGWFQHTLGSYSGEAIALLHVDADWYESTRLCLEGLYDYVVPGGYVIMDDYGHWDGARVATDEFLGEVVPRPAVHRRGYTQAYFRKRQQRAERRVTLEVHRLWEIFLSGGIGVRPLVRRGLDYLLAGWRRAETRVHSFREAQRGFPISDEDLTHWFDFPIDWRFQIGRDEEFREIHEDLSEHAKSCSLPFAAELNLTQEHASILYALVRFLRPSTVIETGVGNGFSTVHVLAALTANGLGKLYSIDYPPLDKHQRAGVGYLIPGRFLDRWHLELDDSVRGLRRILGGMVSGADLFVHDSEHTYQQMRTEFSLVFPELAPRGVMVVDDANANSAFVDFGHAVEKLHKVRWGFLEDMGILMRAPS